ncbi:MAG: hypothetical protein JWR38_4017 [Mucilaginibacter sp.]|nr:hypothetical protein [Mucilaginibacter sp.]
MDIADRIRFLSSLEMTNFLFLLNNYNILFTSHPVRRLADRDPTGQVTIMLYSIAYELLKQVQHYN